jgi:hypothetical protein
MLNSRTARLDSQRAATPVNQISGSIYPIRGASVRRSLPSIWNGVDWDSLEPDQKYAPIRLGNAVIWIPDLGIPSCNSEAWLLLLLSGR